jgi:hypothetical protein
MFFLWGCVPLFLPSNNGPENGVFHFFLFNKCSPPTFWCKHACMQDGSIIKHATWIGALVLSAAYCRTEPEVPDGFGLFARGPFCSLSRIAGPALEDK